VGGRVRRRRVETRGRPHARPPRGNRPRTTRALARSRTPSSIGTATRA
jgi:hypothetical protein